MLRDNPPPPHATHLTSAFGPAVFAKASAANETRLRAALKGLVDALVSPNVADAELHQLFMGTPGSGEIIPALIKARRALGIKP